MCERAIMPPRFVFWTRGLSASFRRKPWKIRQRDPQLFPFGVVTPVS